MSEIILYILYNYNYFNIFKKARIYAHTNACSYSGSIIQPHFCFINPNMKIKIHKNNSPLLSELSVFLQYIDNYIHQIKYHCNIFRIYCMAIFITTILRHQ